MQRLGFEVVRELDPFLLEVSLPEFWYAVRDLQRPCWSLVYDGNGRLRCQLMMGHANWDTIVANWLRRYSYDLDWHSHFTCALRWSILDDGVVVYESPWQQTDRKNATHLGISYVREAVAYLNLHHPQWRDLFAYW